VRSACAVRSVFRARNVRRHHLHGDLADDRHELFRPVRLLGIPSSAAIAAIVAIVTTTVVNLIVIIVIIIIATARPHSQPLHFDGRQRLARVAEESSC
jgi:hypothetical protein